MKKLISLIVIILFFSCASKKKEVVKETPEKCIKPQNEVVLYNIDLDKMITSRDYLYKLHKFPFISEDADLDFKGHFPVEFYQRMKYNFKAKELKNVDFWKLKIYPYSLDVIYVKPVWLEDFKRVDDNLLDNLCYTFNISKREEEILLWWLKNGGVLWLETGIYATGFEYIKRDGTINLKKIKNKIFNVTKNLKFFDYNVQTTTFTQKSFQSISLTSGVKFVYFNNLKVDNMIFKDIKKLKVVLKYPIETFFTLKAKGLITYKGLPLLNVLSYGKGLIIMMLPFDYLDANFDGELLRWKLLEFINSYYENLKNKKKK